jgi:hypothetical protein
MDEAERKAVEPPKPALGAALRLAPVRCYSCNRLNDGVNDGTSAGRGAPYCCRRMRLGQGPKPPSAR